MSGGPGGPGGPNISFAGCGFVGVYHIGVSACLRLYAPQLLENKVGGSSAGAMAAAALVCSLPLPDIARPVVRLAAAAHQKALGPFSPSFDLNQLLRANLEQLLPEDAASLATGRLYISMTRLADRSNLLVSSYSSRADLLEAILASSFIPLLSGWRPPRYRGQLMCDGGCSDNLPALAGSPTITVSPFAGTASICPEEEGGAAVAVSLAQGNTSLHLSRGNLTKMGRALVPPDTPALLALCRQGFQDGLRYLRAGRLLLCTRCVRLPTPQSDCSHCQAIIEEAETKTLPMEIVEVFYEKEES